jgi:hypothetical protein
MTGPTEAPVNLTHYVKRGLPEPPHGTTTSHETESGGRTPDKRPDRQLNKEEYPMTYTPRHRASLPGKPDHSAAARRVVDEARAAHVIACELRGGFEPAIRLASLLLADGGLCDELAVA